MESEFETNSLARQNAPSLYFCPFDYYILFLTFFSFKLSWVFFRLDLMIYFDQLKYEELAMPRKNLDAQLMVNLKK